jgi:MFS family permease
MAMLPQARRLAGLMFALSVMSYFDRTIMSIAGPRILAEYNFTETQLGMVYSAFLCSYAFLMIPAGYLADRIGPRLALTIMALGSGLFTALTALGGQPWLSLLIGVVPGFILMRLAVGLFTAPLYPACARLNANWYTPETRSRVQGIVASGAGLGGAISPILFSWLMTTYGWRASFIAAGAATILLGVIWHYTALDAPVKSQNSEPVPWRQLLTNRNLNLLTLGFMAVDYFEYIFFFWSYYYFGQIRKLSPDQTAIYTTIMMLAWLVMTPIGGWLSDRLVHQYGIKKGLRTVAIGGLGLSAILLFAGAHTESPGLAVTFMSLALGFASCADVTFWAATINVAGKHSGTAAGIMNSGGNLGGFIAPILTPWIAERAGWAGGLYFGSAIALIGLAVWFFIDPAKTLTEEL